MIGIGKQGSGLIDYITDARRRTKTLTEMSCDQFLAQIIKQTIYFRFVISLSSINLNFFVVQHFHTVALTLILMSVVLREIQLRGSSWGLTDIA